MPDSLRVIVLVSGGGIAGGLLYWTSLYLASLNAEETTRVFPGGQRFLFAQLLTGMGGAWAVLLAMIWAQRTSLGSGLEQELELFATSLVSGYAGNRLLPAIADQLTRQILKDAERRTARSARRAKQSELMAEVYSYLHGAASQTEHQTQAYKRKLQVELKKDGLNRKAAILLARLLDEAEKAPRRAIAVLEKFIATKTANGKPADVDVADSYWNIASYNEELFAQSGGKDRKWRDAAVEAAAQAVTVMPAYLKNLREDTDFQPLLADPEMKKRLPVLADGSHS